MNFSSSLVWLQVVHDERISLVQPGLHCWRQHSWFVHFTLLLYGDCRISILIHSSRMKFLPLTYTTVPPKKDPVFQTKHRRLDTLQSDTFSGSLRVGYSGSDSRCCSEPVFYAAVEKDGTSGLVREVFNDSDKVCADVVLLYGCPRSCMPNNSWSPTGMSTLSHSLQHISGKDRDRRLRRSWRRRQHWKQNNHQPPPCW